MKLVVRLKPQPTESLRGYLLRLSKENGYPSPTYVLSLMKEDPSRSRIGRLDAIALMSLADLSAEEVWALTLRSSNGGRAYVRIQGVDLPSYEVDTVNPKFCPSCLAEREICEAFWDLAQARACPLHCVELRRNCGGCNKPISWDRSDVTRCRCGYKLATSPVTPVSSSLSYLMALMRHSLYRDWAEESAPLEMAHLRHLGIRKLCKLLWVMTNTVYSLQAGLKGGACPKSRVVYRPQLELVAEALSDWPHGYQRFLAETYQLAIESPEGLPNFRRLFNWLINRLIKNDADGGGDYMFMLEQTFLFGASFWTRDAMMRSEDDLALMPRIFRWGTVSDATKFLNIHPATARKLINAGSLRVRKLANGSDSRSLIVDMECARNLAISKYPAVPLRAAAASLGLSIDLLKALRISGIFLDRHLTYPGAFAYEDIEAFAAKIRALGRGKGRGTRGRISLRKLMCGACLSLPEKVDLVKRVFANPGWVVGKLGHGFGALLIEKSLVDQLLIKELSSARGYIAVRDAAKILGCNIINITALKREGYIALYEGGARGQICKRSFEAFAESYEPLRKIARRRCVPIKRVVARVDLSGVDHITLPAPRHSTVFVARRHSDLVEERIDALA